MFSRSESNGMSLMSISLFNIASRSESNDMSISLFNIAIQELFNMFFFHGYRYWVGWVLEEAGTKCCLFTQI